MIWKYIYPCIMQEMKSQTDWSNEEGGGVMQEVFEKIIEKLESEYENLKEMYKRTKDMSFYFTFQGVNKAIEIVKKEAEKYKDGHFGCNTNGEHERCDGCGLTNCKSRNKIWFGVGDDCPESNAWSNGWIPCSERLPSEDGLYNVTVKFWHLNKPIVIYSHFECGKWTCVALDNEDEVIAWQPLPQPYTMGE